MALEEYNAKRKFDTTSEPQGASDRSNLRRFVVQRHDARKLHYDLRLEIDGVLKSWAVPKGPSMNPEDKRLAIATEDHPVKYLEYEGTIPKGNYGAGVMNIWDQGSFKLLNSVEGDALIPLENGDLKVEFSGRKLSGAFALVKMKGTKKNNQWLLIKKNDAHAIHEDYDAERLTDKVNTRNSRSENSKQLSPDQFVKPMLATQTEAIFNDPQWLYEIKWDGYRILAQVKEHQVKLYSRNGQDYSAKFAAITHTLEQLEQDVILDGEIVVVDEEGVPHFQRLQNYDPVITPGTLRYYVFDLLYLNGHETLSLPLTDRKSFLPDILDGLEPVFYCDHVEDMGTTFYERAIESGLEGVIAKKKTSTYVPGYRSEDWLKIKDRKSEETLICGYTDSETGGAVFGSLILGQLQEGMLTYVGNCGSGFTSGRQQELLQLFKKFEQKESPFPDKINLLGRTPHWMQPKLVCEVHFSEWTPNGVLRHPVFKGIREDKTPKDLKQTDEGTTQKAKTPTASTSSQRRSTAENLEIDGHLVPVSNLEKVYWPESGLRKYDLIEYYIQVSDTILPYLKDRPQNLHRHPNGINGESFYQKDHENLPEFAETLSIRSKSNDKYIDYLLCQNQACLIYLANLGCIELNPWNSKKGTINTPDYTVIDLDPAPKNDFKEVITCAQGIKELLDKAQIEACVKTSGSRGLHIYIPLSGKYSYAEARDFTKLLCYYAQDMMPKLCTMERKIDKRGTKIYLDYLQNRKGQTLAAPYCVRPRKEATVSAPIAWDELTDQLNISDFTIQTVPERLERVGDLFKPILQTAIDMEAALELLEE